jgi:hypothetical protein
VKAFNILRVNIFLCRYLHFMPDCKKKEDSLVDFYWPLDSIVMMVTRRWQLRERAVELFLSSGRAELVAFETTDDMESFLGVINKCHLSNRYILGVVKSHDVFFNETQSYILQFIGFFLQKIIPSSNNNPLPFLF